jgi:hypothetical protein
MSIIFERVEQTKPLRRLYKGLGVICAVGIVTGCTTLATSLNRIHDLMTKPDTPEESHNYGAFFRSSQSLTSELPSAWSEHNFRQYDRVSLIGSDHDLADPDLIGRVYDNAADFRNALLKGQFEDENPVNGHRQRKPDNQNPPADTVRGSSRPTRASTVF